tara:strand:+ start:162 stop:509 length:348 start_codon:yes stop_codon:yes gene_type:complete
MKFYLTLEKGIDLDKIRDDISSKRFSRYSSKEQCLIYELIHRHSNYEAIMWDFYKQDYHFVINQLSTLLLDISKLDKDLSWSCQIILDRYKKDFHMKQKKSFYVENNYLELRGVV